MFTRKLESVLCADDDPDIIAVLQATLTLIAGLDVRITRSGERLIGMALERQPDLVLIDVMMPGLDGLATLERMRGNPLLAHIPVIFLTAKVMPSDIELMLTSGALGVIAKPFDPLKVGEQIITLWEKGRATCPAADAGALSQVSAHVDELVERFLRRSSGELVRLRTMIRKARQGDALALKEVEHIAHRIHGSGAMLGLLTVSALAEAIEHLAAGVLADPEAHGPIAESALVRQLSECIEGLAKALEQSSAAPAPGASFQRAGAAWPHPGAALFQPQIKL
jgi:CheY-like chemotaxis protein